jgi:hypothetical protein
MNIKQWLAILMALVTIGCQQQTTKQENSGSSQQANTLVDPNLDYSNYQPTGSERTISRSQYRNQLEGFWLGQCIANWTGLVTEFDKSKAPFYTSNDWDTPDQPNAWGNYVPHTRTIGFYFVNKGQPWGADDDTDMEYLYQHLLETHRVSLLTPEQISAGWLKHIYSNEDAPFYKMFPESTPERENFLWVSNEKAYYLMKEGLLPPATSEPEHNPNGHSIDAQLTTEIFGLFAPARPDVALAMAELPVRVTAKGDAEWAAKFYVLMHSFAAASDPSATMEARTLWMAAAARTYLPKDSYVAKMYDFVKASYDANPDKSDWEKTRDEIYERYQLSRHDGYVYREGFDAGINFAASLVSLFYGQGDIAKTIKIATLAGWDSDNPAATWGGLLGFMMGKDGVEKAFGQHNLSDTYWIHRTRRNFPDLTPVDEGEDTFSAMAERGVYIVDRAVMEQMGGGVNLAQDVWYIPERR